MKKRELVFIMSLIFLLLISSVSASLGISPSKYEVNFEPGLELEYSFNIFGDIGQEIELYSAGEFADLVEFNKKELITGGGFKVKIKLPDKIEKPGEHRILIGVREKINKETGGVKTSVAVQAPIVVMVPYPGKYAEVSISANNANIGEPINFEVGVSSMGEESIFSEVKIEIYSDKNLVEILDLGSKNIESQTKKIFKYLLDTENYKPGSYEAVAVVDYQESIAKASKIFKIGYLFVKINNYTEEIINKGIQPFLIDIESAWNNKIDDVHGEVFIFKNNKNITSFLTPSISLDSWDKKTLKGYVDTKELEIGEYDLDIKVFYEKNFTLSEGRLKIKRRMDIVLYVVGAIVLVAILVLLVYFKKIRKWHLGIRRS